MSTALDTLVPEPRLLEIDPIDLAAPAARVWELVRHGDLMARSPLVRALFAVRAIPGRLAGKPPEPLTLRIDDLAAQPGPGFRILVDDAPREVAVGAIGKVWQPDIPFEDITTADAFARFAEPGYAKVAWALRVTPRGEHASRLEVEVRVATTDDASWPRFRRYFRLIGPGSRFIRHTLLASLARELGTLDAADDALSLESDALLRDPTTQITYAITIARPPEAIWPWLVQMGGRRAGFYSLGSPRQRRRAERAEIHEELQHLEVGDRIPATPWSDDGFEVLRIAAPRALVLGGLYDTDVGRQVAFHAERPAHFWQVSWAFELEPLDATTTRLRARARAAHGGGGDLRLVLERPVHALMQPAQLRHLAARCEGRLPRDDWRDVTEGVTGAAGMALALMTPFMRGARSHWGLDRATAAARLPGRRARAGAALELDARRRDRRDAGGGLAVDRAARRGPRGLLQLPVAREPRRLRPAQRGDDPPRLGAPPWRRAPASPRRAAARGRAPRARARAPRVRRARRARTRRGQALGERELALLPRADRQRAHPPRQPLPQRVLGRPRHAARSKARR